MGSGGFRSLGVPSTQEFFLLLRARALTCEAERTLNLPRHRTARRKLLGPFEEEEEGIGISSDVVKVKGEDPATPRLLSEVC